MLPESEKVLKDIQKERERQIELWGVQDHPDGTGDEFHLLYADAAKAEYEAFSGKLGQIGPAWELILREEFHEAMSETDPVKLREELVQVAAVALAWCEALDRRDSGRRS